MAVSFALLFISVLSGADGARIIGGKDAAAHSRPYMASLQVLGQHSCGGVLVREDFVLTAAHCDLALPYTVVLGVDSLKDREPAKQEFHVLQSFPHPNYTYKDFANDLMLLKLSGKAQLTKEVQLIPLKTNKLRTGSACITAGWGDIGDNETLANWLQEVNVTVLSKKSCKRTWKEVSITEAMVCAMGARSFQGFCSGDSGGPLVCGGAAAGIVSFSGHRCGDPRTPDVYTCVSCFRRWIQMVLSKN